MFKFKWAWYSSPTVDSQVSMKFLLSWISIFHCIGGDLKWLHRVIDSRLQVSVGVFLLHLITGFNCLCGDLRKVCNSEKIRSSFDCVRIRTWEKIEGRISGEGNSLENDECSCDLSIKNKNIKGSFINVTERSRKLLRDVRLRGGLNVSCCSALSYFYVQ